MGLLLILFIAMIVWRVLAIANYASGLGPLVVVNWDRLIWTHVAITLGVLAVAGGIAAGAYFAFGKAEQAANAAIALVLAAAAVWFGYLNIAGVFKTSSPLPTPASPGLSAAQNPGPSSPRPSSINPTPRANPRPGPATTPSSPSAQLPHPSSPSDPMTPSTPAPQPVKAVDPRIEATTKAFAADLAARCERLAVSFETLAKMLRDPPERSRAAQDAIVQAIDALEKDAKAIEAALDNAPAQLRERLLAAGVDSEAAATFANAGGWQSDLKLQWRSAGVRSVGRLTEPAREAAVLLRDSMGKWTVKAGEPDFGKDRDTQRKVDWARQRTQGQLNFADTTARQIRGN